MILYADASALVKHYLAETDSARAEEWIEQAETTSSCRFTYVEVRRAIDRAQAVDTAAQRLAFDRHWRDMSVIEISQNLVEVAAPLAILHGLRTLDAIHLASALSIRALDLYVATFDRRLWTAARNSGLNVVPASLP